MANTTFVWIGGVTSSTSVNRFDFNFPGNWVKLTGTDSSPIYTQTNEVPGPGDNVIVGRACGNPTRPNYTIHDNWIARSPLLFGGISGGSFTGGYWPGTTLDSSIPGWGTTWASQLQKFEVGKITYYNDPSGRYRGATFCYPFPVLGGGITTSVIETLKGCQVLGMSPDSWDTILQDSIQNPRQQSGLKIKTSSLYIGRNKTPFQDLNTSWNLTYIASDTFKSKAIPDLAGTNNLWIEMQMIDSSYWSPTTINADATTKEQSSRISNFTRIEGSNTKVNFKNSAFYEMYCTMEYPIPNVGYYTQAEYNKDPFIWSSRYTTLNTYYTGNELNLKNCVVNKLNIDAYGTNNVLIDKDCSFAEVDIDVYHDLPYTTYKAPKIEYYEGPRGSITISGSFNPAYTYYTMWKKPWSSPSGVSAPGKITIHAYGSTKAPTLPDIVFGRGFTAANIVDNVINTYSSKIPQDPALATVAPVSFIVKPGVYIGTWNVWGGIIKSDVNNSYEIDQDIKIYRLDISGDGILDLSNSDPKLWKFGKIAGTTYSGGIDLGDSYGTTSTGMIVMNKNIRFINYAIERGINKRTGKNAIETSSDIQSSFNTSVVY